MSRWNYPTKVDVCSSIPLLCVSTVVDPRGSCLGQSVGPGFTERVAAPFAFVVGGDVADAGVQPDGVVFGPDVVKFGFEFAGVADLLQVWPLALDVAEEGFDPGLVAARSRPAEPLHDRAGGHELPGRMAAHLRAVVTHREQHWGLLVVEVVEVVEAVEVGLTGAQSLQQLGIEQLVEAGLG